MKGLKSDPPKEFILLRRSQVKDIDWSRPNCCYATATPDGPVPILPPEVPAAKNSGKAVVKTTVKSTPPAGGGAARERRKALRTAQFWAKRLALKKLPNRELLDLAAKLGGNKDTSYRTSSLVLGMMLALRQTQGDSAEATAKVKIALRQWI